MKMADNQGMGLMGLMGRMGRMGDIGVAMVINLY